MPKKFVVAYYSAFTAELKQSVVGFESENATALDAGKRYLGSIGLDLGDLNIEVGSLEELKAQVVEWDAEISVIEV